MSKLRFCWSFNPRSHVKTIFPSGVHDGWRLLISGFVSRVGLLPSAAMTHTQSLPVRPSFATYARRWLSGDHVGLRPSRICVGSVPSGFDSHTCGMSDPGRIDVYARRDPSGESDGSLSTSTDGLSVTFCNPPRPVELTRQIVIRPSRFDAK